MKIFSLFENKINKINVENLGSKTVFKIPVDNLTREEAEQQIKEIMKTYKEIIVFDIKDDSNEMIVNGDIKIPFKKEYWIPVNSIKK